MAFWIDKIQKESQKQLDGGVLKRQVDGREKKQSQDHPNQVRKLEKMEKVRLEVEKRKRDCEEYNIRFHVRITDQNLSLIFEITVIDPIVAY